MALKSSLCCWSLIFAFIFTNLYKPVCPLLRYKRTELIRILTLFNSEYQGVIHERQLLEWKFVTNLTEGNAQARQHFERLTVNAWMTTWKRWAKSINVTGISGWPARAVEWMANGVAFSEPNMASNVVQLEGIMTDIYASASVYSIRDNIKLTGENEVNNFMANNRDKPDLLAKIWRKWHAATGRAIRPYFMEVVSIYNQAAQENGYQDIGEAWRSEMGIENDDVIGEALRLWKGVEDLYHHLHAYVRRKLRMIYPTEFDRNENKIPLHLLGNLWGENWLSLRDDVLPFPSKRSGDVLSSIIQYYPNDLSNQTSVRNLVKFGEQFYVNMGLLPLTKSFWGKSVFKKPKDGRKFDCHPKSFDFMDGEDFRISICFSDVVTEREMRSLIHELGHIEYFMAYRHLPAIFRNGANSAFHEAVGESMVLIFKGAIRSNDSIHENPAYITDFEDYRDDINFLMGEALSTFVALPWSLVVELWRYELFSGSVDQSEMNGRWWELRERYQGIRPPGTRSEKDFDPGAKYQIANNMPYIRYYFSRFLAHQFHEVLCRSVSPSELSVPLHRCRPEKSSLATSKFRLMLSSGSLYPWPEILNKFTGSRTMRSEPLMTYYKPLYDWLKMENEAAQDDIGWRID